MFKAPLKVKKELKKIGQQMKFNGRIWDSFQSIEVFGILHAFKAKRSVKAFKEFPLTMTGVLTWSLPGLHAHSTIPQAYHNPPTPVEMFLEEVPVGEALDRALARDVVPPFLHGSVLNEEVLVVVLNQALIFLLVHFFLRA
jgi:hypothetical protein